MSLIKSISGIRGTIGGATGENLTPIDIVKFTTAYAGYIQEIVMAHRRANPTPMGIGNRNPIKIVVGRDARISGGMVQDLVVATLRGFGANVVDVGLCTTPGVEMAVTHYKADGGIIITASHNPRQWNALKLLDAQGEFLSAQAGAEILRLADDENFTFAGVDELGNATGPVEFTGQHIRAVLNQPLIDVAGVRNRRFKVVVDAVNSVGGEAMPALLRELGCEVVCLNCEPTGEFAHNPEPLPENLTEIADAVVREGADLGIVVDPDVDRLAMVCEDGSMFGEEYTLVAVADYVLGASGGGNTVSNMSSSRALRDVTERHGGSYAAAAVGEVNVVARMKETGAVIGGEGNGGVIYPALHYGRDALVGAALFLTHLARSGLSMTALRATYPSYHISKNRIELTPDTNVDAILHQVKQAFTGPAGKAAGVMDVSDIDGVKIDFADRWVHLRRSNTEPIVRIYSEAPDRAAADALAQDIILKIKALK
jgi:phosphomannomutase